MIECRPQGICSWNYFLTGEGWDASVRIGAMFEQGAIEMAGREFTVRKQGFASGTWTLESGGDVLLTARKDNPFTRSMAISGLAAVTELRAVSAFSRSMVLAGNGIDCRIEPLHAFTRRATIAGRCPEPMVTCFAFWLTALLWRRESQSAAS